MSMDRPTILQILPSLVTGGVERGTVDVTAALTRAGFRALVASAGGPMTREVEAAGGTHMTLPLESKNPITMLLNIRRLVKLIHEEKIDLIHARSRAPAWSAWGAAAQAHIPFVTTFHSPYGAGSPLKRFYNSVMAKGARVITISSFVTDYAQKTYGVSSSKMRQIPRGVDTESFDPAKITETRKESLRRLWNLTEGQPLLLMPGRLTRWKGQLVLIQALAQLKRRDYQCVIVGGGKDSPYGTELAAAIHQAGLDNRVFLHETCRDMEAAYALASLVLVPSTRPEGFGRVVIEAQAMGALVIASNHGGARETVVPDQTGFLTKPNDPHALAETIDRVLSLAPSDRAALGSRAMQHVRANFTTRVMTERTLAVYRELLAPTEKGARFSLESVFP